MGLFLCLKAARVNVGEDTYIVKKFDALFLKVHCCKYHHFCVFCM